VEGVELLHGFSDMKSLSLVLAVQNILLTLF